MIKVSTVQFVLELSKGKQKSKKTRKIVLPGIPYNQGLDVRIGDPVRFVRPDGSTLDATIAAFHEISTRPPNFHAGFTVKEGFCSAELPEGTEVWLLNDKQSAV